MSNKQKNELSKKYFEKIVADTGYKLLSSYKNNKEKVELECPNGHNFSISPYHFKNGTRCSICSGKNKKHAENIFYDILSENNYKILTKYKGSHRKVRIECPEGHIYEVTPTNFKQGKRCSICSGNNNKVSKSKFISLIKKEGYTLNSSYVNSLTKVNLICPEGHEWSIRPSHFVYSYSRCPHCKGSTGQRLLQSMLEESINHKMVYNDRKVLNGLELDIYFPELNIAIEYQGDYWHSKPEAIERDKRKRQLCKKSNIGLMTIWDSEFMNSKERVLKKVFEFIGGFN